MSWFRQHWVSVALSLSLVAFTYVLWQVTETQNKIQDSQVLACQKSLEDGGVRYAIADVMRDGIADTEEEIARSTGPEAEEVRKALNLSPERYAELVAVSNARRLKDIEEDRELIRDVLSVDCEAQFRH